MPVFYLVCGAAVLTALRTTAFLIIGGDWLLTDPFLLPSLVLSAVMVGPPSRHRALRAPVCWSVSRLPPVCLAWR